MARSFLLWLHGFGDYGPANEPIRDFFTSPEFRNAVWFFPSAPSTPVTCNCALFYFIQKTLGGGGVFSGRVPFNLSVIAKITLEAKKTPIFWSHDKADRTVLFEAGKAGPPFLQQASFSCEFKAYPDLGHSISSEELRSLESWINTHLQSSS